MAVTVYARPTSTELHSFEHETGRRFFLSGMFKAELEQRFAEELEGLELDLSIVDSRNSPEPRPVDNQVSDIRSDTGADSYVVWVDHKPTDVSLTKPELYAVLHASQKAPIPHDYIR